MLWNEHSKPVLHKDGFRPLVRKQKYIKKKLIIPFPGSIRYDTNVNSFVRT